MRFEKQGLQDQVGHCKDYGLHLSGKELSWRGLSRGVKWSTSCLKEYHPAVLSKMDLKQEKQRERRNSAKIYDDIIVLLHVILLIGLTFLNER